jgi:hypothetical protein
MRQVNAFELTAPKPQSFTRQADTNQILIGRRLLNQTVSKLVIAFAQELKFHLMLKSH